MDEQHTPRELKSIIERGATSYFFSNGITKVVSLANTLIVLTSLTTYAYGVAELALSVLGVFSIFQLSGLERTVVSDMGLEKGAGRFGAMRRLFDDFIYLLIILCTVAWAILFFGSGFVGHFFTSEIGSYFVIISFLMLTAPIAAVMRMLYAVYFDFTTSAAFTFLQEATKLAFLVTIFLLSDITIATVLWSYVVAQCAPAFVLLPRTLRLTTRIRAHAPEGTFSPSRFFYGHTLWTLISNYIDSSTKSIRLWLIKLFFGTEAVALFAVAVGLVGQLSSFLQINTVVAPILPQYVNNQGVFFRIISVAMKYQLILAFGLIVAGLLGVPILVRTLFPHYVAALPLFTLVVFVLIPSSINSILQTMFYVARAQKNLLYAQLSRLVLVCGLGTIFYATFGIVGVALEYLITTTLFGLDRYRVLKVIYPDFSIRVGRFFAIDEYDRMLVLRIRQRIWPSEHH